jgi:Mn-containing catalase
MHQNQWMAVLEDLGPDTHPVPNSFLSSQQNENLLQLYSTAANHDSTAFFEKAADFIKG